MVRVPPLLACVVFAGSLGAQTVVARFALKERFGVSHPDQPVEFSYSGGRLDAKSTRMLGPGGEEVPYQQLSSGNILIRTRLPASRIATVYSPTQVDPRAGRLVGR